MSSDNDSNDGGTSSEMVLFSEYRQALDCINTLCERSSSQEHRDQALVKLRSIFDKYLECPTLLDPYLERMVSPLAESARQCMESGESVGMRHISSALYALCKVRGRKYIQRFLPHEARDVEPVLRELQCTQGYSDTTSTDAAPPVWESVYILWLWLGKLSLIPFDYTVITNASIATLIVLAMDHLGHSGPTRDTAAFCLAKWLSRPDLQSTELPKFVDFAKKAIEESKDQFLVMGILQTLNGIIKTQSSTVMAMEPLWVPMLEFSSTKNSNNEMRKLWSKWFARMACAYLPPRVAPWRYQRGRRCLLENLNTLSASNHTKEKSSEHDKKNPAASETQSKQPTEQLPNTSDENDDDDLFFVPDQVEDAMDHLIKSLTDASTVVRWSAAKGVGRVTERLPSLCAHDVLDAILDLFVDPEKDHAWHGGCLALAELARRGLLLPSRLQDVVPAVVKAIQYDVKRGHASVGAHVRDAACYTYWAFARAYAPSVLRPYIPQLSESIILACLFDREVNCRRAASAAFQECVGRQGADNFKHGISILTTADYFSLGNRHDAYTSVARHVAQFPEYQKPIFRHLYQVKLYHWDIAIRTLSAKSLHDLASLDVDFAANTVVPYLLLLCTNDSLLVRHGAVLGLAEVVLALGTIRHDGDENSVCATISELSLSTIADMVPTIEKARLYRGRGGEIMRSAVCRLMECTCLARVPLTVRQQVRLLDSVDACLKHPSEDVQENASRALYALMRSYFPVGPKGPSDRLQKRVVDKYVEIVDTDDNPAATRGFALALGSLPSKVLAPSLAVLGSVLDCLCKAARFDAKVGGEGDAETRRNAIVSLSRICDTVGIGSDDRPQPSPVVGLNQYQVFQVFDAFFLALQDYNMDRRGDVGSWSRIAAMSGLQSLTILAAKASSSKRLCCEAESLLPPPNCDNVVKDALSHPSANEICADSDNAESLFFDIDKSVRVIGALLKQLSEKLDSVRSHAGQCLATLLTENVLVPFIADRRTLLEALDLDGTDGANATNWADAAITFPMVMKAADIDVFFGEIISGMVISVGGITKSVTKHATAALLQWVRRAKAEGSSSSILLLGDVLLCLFERYQGEGRVILPLLKTLDILISHGCLDELVHDEASPFSKCLFTALKTEARNCGDVQRLLAIVGVSLALLSSRQNELIQQEILPFVFKALVHRFPRVRRFTADQLYMRLLEDPTIIYGQYNAHGAMELLLNTTWDGDLELCRLREARNQVATMLDVSLPDHKKSAKCTSKVNRTRVDEYDSYVSLVNEASR